MFFKSKYAQFTGWLRRHSLSFASLSFAFGVIWLRRHSLSFASLSFGFAVINCH
jgi:hypothetical protein